MSNENLDSTTIRTSSRSQDDTQPVSPTQNVSLGVNVMDFTTNSQNDTLPLSQIDTPGSQLDTEPVSPIKGLNSTGKPHKPLHFVCDNLGSDGKDPRIEMESADVGGMDSDTDFSDGENELTNSNTRGYSQASTADIGSTCGIDKGSSDPMSVEASVNSSLTNSHSSADSSVTGNISRIESIGKTSNSDDSEVIQSSQDIFSSQPVSSGSHDQPSSSQLVPTLQLSGEVTPFEPNFVPSRLMPSTPSVQKDRGANANTSTPVRPTESAEAKSSEIISLSDDEISITTNDKNTSPLGDKRKLSDGSDDSGGVVPASKRLCRNQSNSRQSVMVLAEVCKSVKAPTPSENLTQSESQAFHLHFSASQSDRDTPDSQRTSGSSVGQTGSWKSNWESNPSTSSNELKESSYCDTISKDCSSSNHNVTIYQVEDPEDDVQLILPKNPHTFEEIILDTSGNRPGTSVDGIEVLSPADKPNAWKQSTSVGQTGATNFVTPCSSPTVPGVPGVPAPPLTGFPLLNQRFRAKFLTPSAPDAESLNIWKPSSSLGQIQVASVTHCSSPAITNGPPPPLSFSVPNQRFRAKHSTPQTPGVESPHGNLSSIHDPDHSKENIQSAKQPGIIEYEREFFVTFTKTCKIICKASVNVEEKKVVHVSVEKLQDGEAKSISNDELKKESSHEEETSSIPSQGSPGSVMSGPGPFNLPKRQSIVSTISSSSASSSASGMYHRGAGNFPHFRTGNTSHVDVDFQSTSRQEMDPLFKDLVLHDTSCPSISGSQVLDQWASTSSHLMRQWVDGLVKNELIVDCDVLPEQKLSAVQEIGDEETLGIVIPTVKKLPAARGRKKKAAADKQNPSQSITPRSTRKNSHQVEKTPVDERTLETTAASTESTPISVQDPPSHPTSSTSEVTKVQTPRKKPVRGVADKLYPRPSQEHTSLTSIDFFEPGAPVFALYNGFYYPAELQSLARSNYWNVKFHDGLKSTVNVKFIRLFNTLEIGQAVFAKSGNLDYAHGVVTAISPLPGKDDMYTVDLHEAGTVTVPKSDLGLSVEQAKAFMNDTQPEPASSSSLSSSPHKRTPGTKPREMLDLGQVIDSKRRTPKQSGCSSPCQPGVSNTARRLISDSSSSQEDGPLATVIVAGVEPEQEGFSCADPLARKGKGIKGKKDLPDIEDEDTIKKFGPLPAEGSRIFAGKWFLLTCTDARPIHRTRVDLDSSRQSSDIETDADGIITKHNPDSGVDKIIRHNTDSECFEFSSCPLSKERLCRQIELGGGKVVKDLTEVPPKELKNTYVVTNRPCLTPTYIMCIIRGVQSLSHDYIIACCKENEKLSSELHNSILPVGFSVVRRGFVAWREHKTKSPLHGKNVLVAGDGSFKKFWEEVVCMAGAKVVNLKANKGMEQVTVIVSDNPCEDTILQAAHKHRIPIVSPVWVKQSLINNKALSFDAHRSFAYDAVDTD